MKHLALDGWLETTTGVGTRGGKPESGRPILPICRCVVQSKLWLVRLCAEKCHTARIFWRWITVWLLLNWLLTPAISFGAIEADIDFHSLCAKCSKNRFLYQFL